MTLSKQDNDKLNAWAVSAKIKINIDTLSKIERYHDILFDWSAKMNLVSHSDRERIIENHFLDSLGPLENIPQKCRIIDIGSGAGFPGIPVAIFRPQANITLLESIHKKAVFLKTAIDTIGLSNVIVLEKRLEEIGGRANYDIALVRALPKREQMMPHIYKILSLSGQVILFIKRGQYSVLENSPA